MNALLRALAQHREAVRTLGGILTILVPVAVGTTYAAMRYIHSVYFIEFGLSPEDVGISDIILLAHSGAIAILFGITIIAMGFGFMISWVVVREIYRQEQLLTQRRRPTETREGSTAIVVVQASAPRMYNRGILRPTMLYIALPFFALIVAGIIFQREWSSILIEILLVSLVLGPVCAIWLRRPPASWPMSGAAISTVLIMVLLFGLGHLYEAASVLKVPARRIPPIVVFIALWIVGGTLYRSDRPSHVKGRDWRVPRRRWSRLS